MSTSTNARDAAILTIAVLAVFVAAIAASAQAPPGDGASFEAASIKRNTSGADGGSFGGTPGRLVVVNNTLRNIIRNTYGVQDSQIAGGPDWVNSERFDITARAAGNPPLAQMQQMMRRLLAERFRLVTHMETRDVPAFALILARADGRLGPQLRKAAVDCFAIATAARQKGVVPEFPPQRGNRPGCGTRTSPGILMGTGVTMVDLARNLERPAERPVVDRTGLTGYWDLDVTYLFEGQLPPGFAPPPAGAPSLFTALQEQLGLKLDAQRLPIEVLVIDSAERPTED